ncbi:hypothetical protein WA577_002561 [Blastocystis sp. JDR]
MNAFDASSEKSLGTPTDTKNTLSRHPQSGEWLDVYLRALLSGRITLEGFLLKVFVGGFSYADYLKAQFEAFYARPDTFSLGICNGCQLMAQLNFVPWKGIEEAKQPRFIQNKSTGCDKVYVEKSSAIMLKGLEVSTLGVWVAHGESSHFSFKNAM